MSWRREGRFRRAANGRTWFAKKPAPPIAPPSMGKIAATRAWNLVWRSLTPAQQDAWQRLRREEKDATYKMTADEFAAFMQRIDISNE